MPTDSPISISVVVPVYTGQDFLPSLLRQLDEVRASWIEGSAPMQLVETILVDDSAIDDSPSIVEELAARYPWVTPLHLMRNFGQHSATIAGILHSSGDWVVTLDEDLQHPPSEIEALLRTATQLGLDIVYAKPRNDTVHESVARDWGSRLFKRLMVWLTGNSNVAHFNSFRLLRGPLARAASSACGHETYFDVALSWFTERIRFTVIDLRDQRFISSGASGYNFRKLLSHARRMLVSSQVKAVRLFGLIGLLIVASSVLAAAAILIQKLLFPSTIPVSGWASLMLVIIFFGGSVTFMLSLILEYLSVLVLATHGKPIFFAVDRSQDRQLIEYFVSDPK